MDILSYTLLAFCLLETLNVAILYFTPTSKRGNGMGAFNAYEQAKDDPKVFALISYLVNWVAGTKLIFILLLIGIAFVGSTPLKLVSVAGLIISIATFYWRLYPQIRQMDAEGQISPKGYSRTLAIMIAAFMTVFAIVFGIALTQV